MMPEAKVDLCFKVLGTRIPVDHGFALYGALSRVLLVVHENSDIGIKLIRGRYVGDGMLDISPHSELVLRVPFGDIATFLPLAGKTLDILGCRLSIGVCSTRGLAPGAALHARLVTTRNGHDQSRFETEIRNQMQKIGVHGGIRERKGVKSPFDHMSELFV